MKMIDTIGRAVLANRVVASVARAADALERAIDAATRIAEGSGR